MKKSTHICLAFQSGSRILSRAFNQRIASSGITASQYFLLKAVPHKTAVRSSEITNALGLERSSLSREIPVLIRKGFLERKAISRVHVMYWLTPDGKKAVKIADEGMKKLEAELFEFYGGEDELLTLLQGMLTIVDYAEAYIIGGEK